jgi:DNA-binding CsgD family transcriptional regulator
MPGSQTIPWPEIHELLLAVGSVREPRAFCVRAVRELVRLVPYDQARLYFVDATGHIEDEELLGADPAWSERYVDHFAGLDHGLYSIAGRRRALLQGHTEPGHYVMPGIEGGFYDWEEHHRDEFVAEYVLAQGIRHSAGFAFHDPIGRVASMYALDRTTHSGFTALEVEILRRVQPHLDNLHRNLLVQPSATRAIDAAADEALSRREREVAMLLFRGMTPSAIARELSISRPTVYRHLANIHVKLAVSNRQELMLRLAGMRAGGSPPDP